MELFIKRFIDLLDEMIPVSMVHTLTEQPLGAVIHDYYIRIHARLSLADEESPFVEIELYPYENNRLEALFAYTYPSEGIAIGEEEFVQKIQKDHVKGEKVIPMDEEGFAYEIFYEMDLNVPENEAEMDKYIHQLVPQVKDWLTIGGYEIENEE